MSRALDTVSAALLLIGNEILSGRTQDENLNYIARQLTIMGIRLREVRVVSDDETSIVNAINTLRVNYDYVFTTGGIGPTHDDITGECVSKALGRKYILNESARAILEEYYDGSGRVLNKARLRMAHTPEGAKLIQNSVSKAPGYQIDNVIVMAGIPKVMRAMFEDIAPSLRCGRKVISRSMSVHLGEGDIARSLGRLQERFDNIEIGSYPFVNKGNFGTTLVLRGTDEDAINCAFSELKDIVIGLGAKPETDVVASDESWPELD